jgi:DNA-binding MarR family transcriptional regulator
MGTAGGELEVRSRGWRRLAALHALIERDLERALTAGHHLSVVEFTVLDALSLQNGWHLRMAQLARVAALSSSAATRLVTRLEDRGLLQRCICPEDRRGIYTELTKNGSRLLGKARVTHDRTLHDTLEIARKEAELAPLVAALDRQFADH